jgi:hypothetical protein
VLKTACLKAGVSTLFTDNETSVVPRWSSRSAATAAAGSLRWAGVCAKPAALRSVRRCVTPPSRPSHTRFTDRSLTPHTAESANATADAVIRVPCTDRAPLRVSPSVCYTEPCPSGITSRFFCLDRKCSRRTVVSARLNSQRRTAVTLDFDKTLGFVQVPLDTHLGE